MNNTKHNENNNTKNNPVAFLGLSESGDGSINIYTEVEMRAIEDFGYNFRMKVPVLAMGEISGNRYDIVEDVNGNLQNIWGMSDSELRKLYEREMG